jgi:hypothetical protein
MDKVINTSFIAKQSLAPNSRPGLQPGGVVLMIAWILLFLSLAVFGGTLAYRSLLTQEIKAPCAPTSAGSEVQKCGLVASVGREEKNLDRNTIVLLQRADAKLRLADQLLAQHVDILPVFRLLEEITLPSVSYTKFSYTPNALALEGRALSYEDLAVQSEKYAADKERVKNAIFSDINLDSTRGDVVFKLALTLDPKLVEYTTN